MFCYLGGRDAGGQAHFYTHLIIADGIIASGAQTYVEFVKTVIFSLNLNFSCHESSCIRSAIPDMTYNGFETKYGAGILAEERHQ